MTDSGIRERAVSRDIDAARAAFDVGDIELSRMAHESKIHTTSDEHHAG